MKKSNNAVFIIAAVAAAAGLVAIGYFFLGAKKAPSSATIVATPTDLTQTVSLTGKVKAVSEVDLAFERAGRVVRVPVAAGDLVKRGTLLAALDAGDAAAASEQAVAALSAAQIALEKMQRPPEAIDLLQAKDAVSAANDAKDKTAADLNKAYDGAFSAVSDTYLDLPSIVSGLHDVLHGTDFVSGQENIDFYADLIKQTDANVNADAYRASTENAYQAAAAAVDKSYADFNAAGPKPSSATVASLVAETYAADKLVSDAVNSAGNLIDFYTAAMTEKKISNPAPIPAAATTARTVLSGYAGKANGHFAALSADQAALQAGGDAVASAVRVLNEKQEALAKLVAGAEDIDLRAQQTRVDAAQAAVDAARNEVAKMSLVAPFDGTVSRVDVSVGEMGAPGAPAVSMVSNSNYEIDALVSEADIAKVAVGETAAVTLDTFGNENFDAVVEAVDPSETMANGIGAYGVKLQFVKDDPRIKSGMTANVSIATEARKGVIAVPASAIITRGANKFVLVDNGAGAPAETPVTVGIEGANGSVEIVSGLKAGDKVVTFGNN
jgi:RND family efflux transporter MFP subunit